MEQTRCAFKVVSDPYAPEEHWLPACNEVDSSSSLVPYNRFELRTTYQRVTLTLFLSMLAGAFGGALFGQATHVTYYLHHLFSAALYNDLHFELWGSFYYWFNQAAAYAFIPVMFSYSVGFLGVPFGLGRKAIWLGLVGVALYYVGLSCLTHNQDIPDFGQPFIGYLLVWSLIGVVGSILALPLGRRVAGSLSSIVNPEKLFFAMLIGLVPCSLLYLHNSPILARFDLLVSLCVMTPIMIGMLAPVMLRASSVKSALSLALTANSPIVLCALLHFPIGVWYVSSWSPREQFGLMAEIYQYLFYCLLPLVVPIAAAAIAGLQASKLSIAMRRNESLDSIDTSGSVGARTTAALEDSAVIGLPATSPEFS